MSISRLRLATPSDASEILAVYAPYITNTPITFEEEVPALADFTNRIKSIAAVYPYIVAEEAPGVIRGFAYASPHMLRAAYRWNVETSVYVASEARGRGLGRKLYTALIAILRLQNVENLYACITYPNPESISFHQAMGFAEVGHFPKCGYKAGAWHDIVWLERKLGFDPGPRGEVVPIINLQQERITTILQGEL